MDKAEELMSYFPNLSYIIDKRVPKGQGGMNIDDFVYLSPYQSKTEFTSVLSEELGHYLTTVGDIVDQDTNEKRKQERKARDVGATLVVTPDDLLKCYENGYETIESCADFLGVTKETFTNAINYYRRKDDAVLTENKDVIVFNIDNTIKVYKNYEV
ncbi:ImmA/IrrE family metallo-endopeptidase [Tetragenococcus halophilus]|nr:ImmA/IrrE family metallo-endopeptidase [Tetragenococcus halophilus]